MVFIFLKKKIFLYNLCACFLSNFHASRKFCFYQITVGWLVGWTWVWNRLKQIYSTDKYYVLLLIFCPVFSRLIQNIWTMYILSSGMYFFWLVPLDFDPTSKSKFICNQKRLIFRFTSCYIYRYTYGCLKKSYKTKTINSRLFNFSGELAMFFNRCWLRQKLFIGESNVKNIRKSNILT